MKFRYEIDIEASHERVWAAYEDRRNLPRWQRDLELVRQLAGEPGRPGSIAELVYTTRGRKVSVTETVTERRRPDFLAATYETAQGSTLIVNHFIAMGRKSTRWTCWCNYRFRGFMRMVSLFRGGAVRERMEADMERFKLMVESDEAGNR